MFVILCRRIVRVSRNDRISVHQHQFSSSPLDAVSSRSCSPSVCENASQNSFTISYLINTCGLSPNDAVSASNKLCFKSPEKPDAVLKLLIEYGFTDAHHIPTIVTGWPSVLSASPEKTLLPKLDFFISIGIPIPVLAQKLSEYPFILRRSLKNSLIPPHNDLKSLLGSDERVAHVFSRNPRCFDVSSNASTLMLRERGVPESSIVSLVMYQPSLLIVSKEKLSAYVNRASSMGFDISKKGFISSVQVFCNLTESTLKQKTDVYRKYGWLKWDIRGAFLRYPLCMILSEEKITANMDFLVNTLGCEPAAVAQCPVLLTYNLEKRIKPRCLVAGILKDKGLKKRIGLNSLLVLSEHKFLNWFIVKYEKDVPGLLDIYRGKSSPRP